MGLLPIADGAAVLCLNGGSSSLKLALYERNERLAARGKARGIGGEGGRLALEDGAGGSLLDEPAPGVNHEMALRRLAEVGLPAPAAIGHRVVHGGDRFGSTVRITAESFLQIQELMPLAPLHLPHELALIQACRKIWRRVPQFACFDTAFHRSMPAVARRLPLPRRLERQGIKRYGFHGISYEYVLSALGPARQGRVVIAHLGSGCSLAAVRDGRPIETTMGMTPSGGLMMATRCGDLDPGVLVHLMEQHGYDAAAVDRLINEESGLRGVSEISGDMRELLERAAEDDRAAEAVTLFCYSARKHIGALAAALGGLDLVVFTAGVGEASPEVRSRICEGLAHLGVRLDEAKNRANEPEIGAASSSCGVRVVPANEELMIARHVLRALAGG